jgi:hypothetical protein
MQRAFDLDVISPQDGHILCPDPATSDFLLRPQRSSRTVNSTISRPKEILPALIKATLLGESCIDPASRSIRVLHRGVDRLATRSLQTDVVRPPTR